MSKVKIQGNSSGTGTFTISAPNSNTDRSLTLPDGAGEIITSSTIGSNMPSGSIIQVVNSDNSYETSTTNTTVDVLSSSGTTWETSITPSSTSSKIIVSAHIFVKSSYWMAADVRTRLDILYKVGSGSYSSLSNNQMYSLYDYGGDGVSFEYIVPFQYQISPSTTDAVTFKFTCRSINSGCATEVNGSGTSGNSTCILYEVA